MADQNNVTLPDTSGEITLDLDGICRFCLSETNDGILVNDECLYEESKGLKRESVHSFITKLRIIEMKNFENFPTKICKNCYELIELFHNFSQVCKKSDNLLKMCYGSTLKVELDLKGINKIETSEEKPEILHDNCETCDKRELNSFSKLNQTDFENYGQKLKAFSEERSEEDQLTDIALSHFIQPEDTNLMLKANESSHTCSQCSLQFSSPMALNFHYIAKHSRRKFRITSRFQCQNCIKLFTDVNRLKRHYRLSHNISTSRLTDGFLNSKVKQSVHVEKTNFFCFHCIPHKQFQSKNQLVQHLEECHKMKLTKGDPVSYSCAHCTYGTFMTRLSLNQHMLWVHKAKEDEITWSDVKYVFIARKSHPASPKANISPQKKKPNSLHPPPGAGKLNNATESWNCSECLASYSKKQSLNCHIREKHNGVNPGATKCPECSESFPTNRRLIQHGITVHQKYFAWSHHVFKKALQPVKEDQREKNFECDTCGRRYIYKSSLRKHIVARHLTKSPKGAVACPHCWKTVSNKINLQTHIEFVHEALFVSCPICKKKINLRSIGRHYKVHRTNVDGDFSGSNFLCNLCGRVLKSKRSFEDHQKLHQNIRDEICDVCGSGYTTKKLLRLHKKTHEQVERRVYTCDQCEKVFSGKHTLNRHLLTHSGEKNFICEMCSKGFYTIPELNRHVRCHKKDYRYDCQLCDMRFLYKSRFRHHMMKHRNIRPHKCQFCDKMFIERAKMKLHMAAKHNVEVTNTKSSWKDPKTYVPLDELLK